MNDYFHEMQIASAGQPIGGPAKAVSTAEYFGSGSKDTAAKSSKFDRRSRAANSFYAGFGKRILDLFFVVISLPLTVPLIVLCALALALEGGNPFYRQPRLGRDGREFFILKLRTMVCGAESRLERLLETDSDLRAEWTAKQKLKNDPRITPIGKFLRLTSLDELPQIWNVLRGDMSLVGPRPMMTSQLELHEQAGSYFAVRPGLTGIWQVSCRNERSFRFRAETDAVYASNVNLIGDLRVIWRTVGVVLRCTGY